MLLAVLGGVPAARASEASQVIHRCTHGESLEGFSQKAYRKALQELPTDAREYDDCEELIHKAQLASAGHHRGALGGPPSGPGGGSTPLPLTPTEQRAVHDAHLATKPLSIGNKLIVPGSMHVNLASALNSLPTPLLAMLALLLLAAAMLAGENIRNRVRAHRPR
ncbi:MAG: hypothetical protein ACRDK2_17100 [Solirubrobacteraceae bacterium]